WCRAQEGTGTWGASSFAVDGSRPATASSDASCPTAPPPATPRRSSSAWWHVHTASLPRTSLTRRASPTLAARDEMLSFFAHRLSPPRLPTAQVGEAPKLRRQE